MKILVFSDSHGYYNRILSVTKQHPDADVLIHCGDVLNDAESLKKLLNIPVYHVVGNNDYTSTDPKEISLELEGAKIFVTHGHLYGVKNGLDSLRKKIKEGYNLLLYGHTHIANTEYHLGGTILNPGAMCYTSKSSYAIINIENGAVKTSIVSV